MKTQSAQSLKTVAKLIRTAVGREAIGNSMIEPLRDFQDYSSIMRRGLLVDPLADGAIPYYDRDVDVNAYIVSEEGRDVTVVAGREPRVHVPLFEIATNPTIPFTQIKQRRYDVQQRVQEKTNAEVFRTEDQKIIAAFEKASTGFHPVINVTNLSQLTIDHFSDAMSRIEGVGNNLRCVNIFMNPAMNKVLRKINKDYYSIDFETSKEILNAGYLANLYGAQIHTSGEIPKGKIYFTCAPEYLGRLVESLPLTVIVADNPAQREIGWSIFEQVGILIHNPKGICAINVANLNA